jgi:hypothetical protein
MVRSPIAKSHINGGRDDADKEDELAVYVEIE